MGELAAKQSHPLQDSLLITNGTARQATQVQEVARIREATPWATKLANNISFVPPLFFLANVHSSGGGKPTTDKTHTKRTPKSMSFKLVEGAKSVRSVDRCSRE